MYHIGRWYYLMAAEGGTEYGHMVVLARGETPWGPFANCPHNPILTNRNKAPFLIQGIGHGDLVRAPGGEWFIMTLGFRQIHMWQPFHHLGREVFLTPVRFDDEGWIRCGRDGTTDFEYDIEGSGAQSHKTCYTFRNTDWKVDWCALRCPDWANYEMGEDHLVLRGGKDTIDQAASPTFLALRQRAFDMDLRVRVTCRDGEGGVTVYSCETEHYDLAVRGGEEGFEAVLKLNIGGIRHTAASVKLRGSSAVFRIKADSQNYDFFLETEDGETLLGSGQSKYLSSEVCGGFTGVVLGLYAQGDSSSRFDDFSVEYQM